VRFYPLALVLALSACVSQEAPLSVVGEVPFDGKLLISK